MEMYVVFGERLLIRSFAFRCAVRCGAVEVCATLTCSCVFFVSVRCGSKKRLGFARVSTAGGCGGALSDRCCSMLFEIHPFRFRSFVGNVLAHLCCASAACFLVFQVHGSHLARMIAIVPGVVRTKSRMKVTRSCDFFQREEHNTRPPLISRSADRNFRSKFHYQNRKNVSADFLGSRSLVSQTSKWDWIPSVEHTCCRLQAVSTYFLVDRNLLTPL